jgi:arginase
MLTGTRAPGAGPRLRADSAGPASAARVAVSGHSRPALVHFDVEVVDSGDLPLANFPHYGQGLFLAEAVQCLSAFCASPRFASLVPPKVTLPVTHMAMHWSVTSAAWSRRWPASAKKPG